jgi:hypothetical protein
LIIPYFRLLWKECCAEQREGVRPPIYVLAAPSVRLRSVTRV